MRSAEKEQTGTHNTISGATGRNGCAEQTETPTNQHKTRLSDNTNLAVVVDAQRGRERAELHPAHHQLVGRLEQEPADVVRPAQEATVKINRLEFSIIPLVQHVAGRRREVGLKREHVPVGARVAAEPHLQSITQAASQKNSQGSSTDRVAVAAESAPARHDPGPVAVLPARVRRERVVCHVPNEHSNRWRRTNRSRRWGSGCERRGIPLAASRSTSTGPQRHQPASAPCRKTPRRSKNWARMIVTPRSSPERRSYPSDCTGWAGWNWCRSPARGPQLGTEPQCTECLQVEGKDQGGEWRPPS